MAARALGSRKTQRIRSGLCLPWLSKMWWMHHINTIMRAMHYQSKFTDLSGGLLAPRAFLILLPKDWKLLDSTKVTFSETSGQSAVSKNKNWKGHFPHFPQAEKSSPLVHYAHNRTISHRWLPVAPCVAQESSTGIPVPTFMTSFWAHNAALAAEERESPHLQHMLSYSPVLTPSLIWVLWAEYNAGRGPSPKVPISWP